MAAFPSFFPGQLPSHAAPAFLFSLFRHYFALPQNPSEPFSDSGVFFSLPAILRDKGIDETMKIWRNIFSPLIALLLILLMSTAFASPPGSHLELCFGFDGHLDVSPDFCNTHFNSQKQQDASLTAGLHHVDCLDLAIGCGSYNQTGPPGGNARICKTKVQQESSLPAEFPAGAFSRNLPQAQFQPSFHLNHQDPFPSHLASLRTIVLLI